MAPRRSAYSVPAAVVTAILAVSLLPAAQAGGSAATASSLYTAFTIEAEAGSYVGGWMPQVYAPPEATFATQDEYRTTTREWVFLKVWGVSGTAEGHWWYVNLAAPPGQDLAVGTYTGTVNAWRREPGQPGLDIWGDGAGCEHYGSFTVHEIAFSGDTLAEFAASYEFTCDNDPQKYYGEVRYNSPRDYAGLQELPNTGNSLVQFPDTIVGYATPPETVTLHNAGTLPITVTGTGLTGDHPDDYALTGNTCGELDPGESCELQVAFAPTDATWLWATLTYTTDTHDIAHGIRLRGNGISQDRRLGAQPGSLDFGNVLFGQVSAEQDITVQNLGNVPVSITAISMLGEHPGDFQIASQGCPIGPLAVGASCTIGVRFRPTATGARTATLRISGDYLYADLWPLEVSLAGTSSLPQSGITWGSIYRAGPAYTWNDGVALARTVQSGTQRLHLGYATDRVGSSWAKDAGPYAGIYYTRSTSGSIWSTPKRLNPTSQHALRLSVAAAGSRVYVAWVSQTRIYRYSPTAPRVLYVRVNTSHGAGTAWRSTIRLTSTSGRVDYPALAATGYDVHLAYTDSNTGAVRIATSRDRGLTWARRTIGTTTLKGKSGYTGVPRVAVDGSTVVVAWLADATGTVSGRVSTDRGASWGPLEVIGAQANWPAGIAVRGTRIAVAWTTEDDVVVRQRINGTWGDPRIVASMAGIPEDNGKSVYAPAVALQDTARIAVAWSKGYLVTGDQYVTQLHWTESADAGTIWFASQTVGSSSSARRLNDYASILWPSAGTRYVAWNGWTYGTANYRMYLRKGSGTPIGPTVAAALWQPSENVPPSTLLELDEREGSRDTPGDEGSRGRQLAP